VLAIVVREGGVIMESPEPTDSELLGYSSNLFESNTHRNMKSIVTEMGILTSAIINAIPTMNTNISSLSLWTHAPSLT
jgi:hypothetical protein